MVKDLTVEAIEEALDWPHEQWARQCHSLSLAIVKSGIVGEKCRVARGSTAGVGSQHSWVVVGWDCYASHAKIIDATLWSYVKDVPTLLIAKAKERPHVPHGAGSILNFGRPPLPSGDIIELPDFDKLSIYAQTFLAKMVGPLDSAGWNFLAHAPVEMWPAGEIYDAMTKVPALYSMIPIDRIGMLTDQNPNGMYF